MREFIAREGHSEGMGEGEGEEMRTPREGTSASVETLNITPEAAQADDVLDAIDMVIAAKGGGQPPEPQGSELFARPKAPLGNRPKGQLRPKGKVFPNSLGNSLGRSLPKPVLLSGLSGHDNGKRQAAANAAAAVRGSDAARPAPHVRAIQSWSLVRSPLDLASISPRSRLDLASISSTSSPSSVLGARLISP